MRLVAGKINTFNSTVEGFSTLFFNRVSYRTAGLVFLISTFAFFEFLFPQVTLGGINNVFNFTLSNPVDPATKSLFSEKITTASEVVNYTTRTIIDPSLKDGETKVIKAGSSGKKVFENRFIYHNGQEFSKTTVLIESVPPSEEVVAVAPSKQTIDTIYGTLTYYQKLTVWATSYDASCAGCNKTTAVGLPTGYGVIAVDPKIIPLGSRVYIPGYGVATAGDTGGSIKGNKIDLGFNDVSQGWWSARYTDIYLLT